MSLQLNSKINSKFKISKANLVNLIYFNNNDQADEGGEFTNFG